MSEIISKWILHRLGIVMDMSLENFTAKTANGLILAKILQSYEVMSPQELNLIKESNYLRDCYDNLKLINVWLKHINLYLNDDDIYEIAHGVGLTSLHLFYRVFLELQDKTKLDFLTENELKAQLKRRLNRFSVEAVDEPTDTFNQYKDGICEPFLAGGDVYHWCKDRMENLQNRCKDARDEYIHNVKNRGKEFPSEPGSRGQENAFVLARGLSSTPKGSTTCLVPDQEDEFLSSICDTPYEELVNRQIEAQNFPTFSPNPREVKKVMNNLHTKSKARLENRVLKNQLQQEIMNEFEKKINDGKAKSEDRVLTDTFMKQSDYEKELVTKLATVKLQKDHMLENKYKQAEIVKKFEEKEFVESLILQDKELSELKLTYYLERERILQVHKKIWNERLRLRAKKHEDICSTIVRNMIDISIKIAEYKKRFNRDLSKREIEYIRNLFTSGQPIFDICEPIINIIKDTDEEIPEVIITKEMSRQDIIDQEEFEKYMRYESPYWELQNIDTSPEALQQIGCGLNVLGYIVHKALQAKYPIIPLWEKPNFPDATIRVCINGLNDTSVLPALRSFLTEKQVQVIELGQAIDFSIDAYRQESKREYKDEDSISTIESLNKKVKPHKEKKGQKPNKNKKETTTEIPQEPSSIKSTANKQVQTPIKYPCEEIAYSSKAILGKTAQELLDEGLPLSDFLLIDMFVTYLKSLPNLKGWVLVNYPTSFDQAAILEEALTGIKLLDPFSKVDPPKSLTDITEQERSYEKDACSLYDDHDIKRDSRLLPNPVLPEPINLYDTVLTAYIKIIKQVIDEKGGEATIPFLAEELGNERDLLDRFYSNAGAKYSMYYKEFDLATVKHLAKLIIGDYSLPLKGSIELFGEVNDVDAHLLKTSKALKTGEQLKKQLQKTVAGGSETENKGSEKAGTKDKKGKSKGVIIHEDKSVQMPSISSEDEESEAIISSLSTIEIPTAGQSGWEYSQVEGSEELLIALATLWEAVEEIYINDLKQIFFLKRLNMDSIVLFSQYVKDIMKNVVDSPDCKGFYLAKFQKAFNTFDGNFRKDDEFKVEMHCRIENFKERLAEICDMKMIESENMRCRIINADWVRIQITELLNNSINMLQIELDRFLDSMRFINHFYLGIIVGMPSEEDNNYKEEILPKYHDINSDIIKTMLQDSTSGIDLKYFDELLTMVIQKAHNCVKKLNAFSTSNLEKAKNRQTSTQKPKSKPGSVKSDKGTKKTTDQDNDTLKVECDRLTDEWPCAMKAETLRVGLRFDLIKYDALRSIEEFLTIAQQSFHKVFHDIRSKYYDELENIDKVCRVFKSAVEKEMPIHKELIFDGSTFYVNPALNLFPNPLIIPELSKQIVEESAFTIEQLSKLVDILLDLNPSGYMPKATFTFVLQDIIWNASEHGSGELSPKVWKSLNSSSLRMVIDALYDDLEYVYWKDFIIHNMRIDYPTERELLLSRNNLRECDPDVTELVQDYQFFATKLWFEYAFKQEDSNKITELKRLLYKMYNINKYGLNYTAMLLDFCKGSSSIEGFAKALELSIGKLVCWEVDVGNDFKEEYLKGMQQHEENIKIRDQEREECYKVAYEEIVKLVDYVVHINEDVIIEDLKSNENSSPSIELKQNQSNCSEGASCLTKSDEDQSEIVCLPDNVKTDSKEFDMLFFLTSDVVITIITAALPWHCRVKNIGDLSFWESAAQIFDQCRNSDFNMAVLSHEFLNCDSLVKLLLLTKKFTILDPVRVVSDTLNGNN